MKMTQKCPKCKDIDYTAYCKDGAPVKYVCLNPECDYERGV